MGARALVPTTGAISLCRGVRFFYVGGIFIEKTARSSPPCDGLSWAVSNTAIDIFWCCMFVEV